MLFLFYLTSLSELFKIGFWQHSCSSLHFFVCMFVFPNFFQAAFSPFLQLRLNPKGAAVDLYSHNFKAIALTTGVLLGPPAPVKINCFKAERYHQWLNNKLRESDAFPLISGWNITFGQNLFPKEKQCVVRSSLPSFQQENLVFTEDCRILVQKISREGLSLYSHKMLCLDFHLGWEFFFSAFLMSVSLFYLSVDQWWPDVDFNLYCMVVWVLPLD